MPSNHLLYLSKLCSASQAAKTLPRYNVNASYATLPSNNPRFLVRSQFFKYVVQTLGSPCPFFLSFCSSDRERRVIRSHREVTQLCFSPVMCYPSFSFKPSPFSFNECLSLVLTGRSMGAGLALSPEDLGGGGDSQRRKKRLSSRGFERLSSTQVRVPLSSSLLSSVQVEMKEATLCFFAFDIFLCCTLFLIRCYPQESNPLLSILISFSLGLLLFLFLLCV